MRDHLVCNPARVAADPFGIKRRGPMKPCRSRHWQCAIRNLTGTGDSAWNRAFSTRPFAGAFSAARRLCPLGIKLLTRDLRLDEQPGSIRIRH